MKSYALKTLVICLLMGMITSVRAQYHDTIRTGRPGQSIGPYTVGSHVLQIQSGMEYDKTSNEGTARTLINNNVIRFGLANKWETSAVFDLRTDQYRDTGVPNFSLSGLSNVQVGLRYNIIDHPNGWIPSLGVQVRTRVPMHSSDYKIDRFAPVMALATGHSLDNGWGFNTNWIAAYDGNSTQPDYNYTLNLSFPITNRWSGYVENYGQMGSDFDTYFDGGIAYLVNQNLQVDFYGGLSENDGAYSHFMSAGISWRTKFE